MIKQTFLALLSVGMLASCVPADPKATSSADDSTSGGTSSSQFIYVSTGTKYAGNGVVVSTASRIVSKYRTDGSFVCILADFVAEGNGDAPVDMIDYDSTHLLVLLENTTGRRVVLLNKDCSQYNSTYVINSTALSATLRSMIKTSDGGFLVSKGTAIEKFNSAKQRVLSGAAAFINAPAGSCATSTTLSPAAAIGPSGNIFMLHAAASPNNQINIISSTGYVSAADCLGVAEGPTANHYPTAILYHSSGKMLVAYANTTGPIHQIYQYDVTATTMTNPVVAYNDRFVVQGPVSMAELADKTVLVASGASTFNTVEHFSYDTTTGAMTRIGGTPLIQASVYTQGISSIIVAK